ncbi:Putative aminoacrylate hydrolase RutD [Aedoeadaptatus nemausensis]|uniref:Aminoacrylate hydrolase RutD n=1 Tax=Aedoeadaptatus nemausensis TaxID=2582829 RepID=A0A6V6Y523_9FIRM|nr:alpha/beta fold hydrolase [Peptoniphilus nemausensis]CAC9932395.1 Putative aminoacrylate hydrolase RutD [Peptoniphilus nemausensis]
MNKVLRAVIIVLIVVLIAFTGFSFYIGGQVFDGFSNAVSREETVKNSKGFIERIGELKNKYEVKELQIEDPEDSSRIPALYIKKAGNKNVVCMVHGMGGTKETLAPLMEGFLQKGFDVLAYDQRNSGENQKEYNTFGVLESRDALAILNYIAPAYKGGKVALWGESMGALTAVLAAGEDDSLIDCLILDSPVSDGRVMIENEMASIAESQNIPIDYLSATGSLYSKFKIGVSFKDMDGVRAMKKISKPVLITNSKDDKLTPPSMANDLFSAVSHDQKKMETVTGYKHATYPYRKNGEYMKTVGDFLDQYFQ